MIGAPAVVKSVGVRGFTTGFHYHAKTGLWTKVMDVENTIVNPLKANIRDSLYTNNDYALDDLFTVDGEQFDGNGHTGGVPANIDGVIGIDTTNNKYLTFITVVHPIDPSGITEGSYYRQWQAILTNDYGVGTFNMGGNAPTFDVLLGVGLSANFVFAHYFAEQNFDAITLVANDIFTVNWKILIG